MKKNLVISSENKNSDSNKNLYLNYLFYTNLADTSDSFSEAENMVEHYSKNIDDICFHEDECEKIYINIFNNLVIEFNKLHKKNYDKKALSLILGHWLKRFIKVCYDRYFLLTNSFKNNKIEKLNIIDTENYNFSTKESGGIFFASIDPNWNYALTSRMIKFFTMNDYIISTFKKKNTILDFELKKFSEANYRSLKFVIAKKILDLFETFQKKENSVITSTYFPYFYEKKLEFGIGQLPRHWDFNYQVESEFDLFKRKKMNLSDNLNKINLENFIKLILPLTLPVSFIEGFEDLLKKQSSFPGKPKFIFSCSSYDMNDLFKIYSATKISSGTKIISGQHGSGSFLLPESKYLPELKFSDYYMTWGNNDRKEFFPLFNHKIFLKTNKSNVGENLVIFSRSLGYCVSLHDRQKENISTISTLHNLSNKLSKKILDNTRIKPHSFKNKNLHHNLLSLYKNINLKKLEDQDFFESTKKSKISLFLYNSSGILECLALNKPVVCYWPDTYKQINPKFIKKFELLKESKIFFDNENSLVDHLESCWDDVPSWWDDSRTKKNIREFNKDLNLKPENQLYKNFSTFLLNLNNKNDINKTDDIYTLW